MAQLDRADRSSPVQPVTVLVDMRLTPISRKPGLSKTALAFNRTASNMCTSASWQPQSEPAWIPKR
jgi:hypothetical protein